MLTFIAIANAAITSASRIIDPAREDVCELQDLARTLDELRVRLAADARSMSERFTRYANEVDSGEHVHEPPTGWSTLRDMDRDAATFRAKLDAFKVLCRIVTGKSVHTVRDALESKNA